MVDEARDWPWTTVMLLLSAIGTAIAIGTVGDIVSQAIGGDIVLRWWLILLFAFFVVVMLIL